MSSIYDASVIRAALPHVNGDLFNVIVYMFLVQDEKQRTELTEKILLPRQKSPLKLGQGKNSLILSPLVISEKT